MAAVLGGVVASAVADPVALGEQAGDGGDVGVGGADRYAEAGREAGKGVVAARVHECDERTLVRRELASPVTLVGDDKYRDPLDQSVRQVECGRVRNQQDFCAAELRHRTPLSTAREPRGFGVVGGCPFRTPTA